MSNYTMQAALYADDVQGIIVGGAPVTWQLFYDGKAVSDRLDAETDDAAISAARTYKHGLIDDNAVLKLYPDDSKWEARLW